jgi:hypothetical protein
MGGDGEIMPLRVTVEIIPHGNEGQKRRIAVVDIANDGTGNNDFGNYVMRAEGECQGGYDTFYHGKLSGVRRGDYLNVAIDCLKMLYRKRIKRRGK